MQKLSELGEFALIDKARKMFKMDSSVIVGPGDDCAVIVLDKYNYQLLTCDMIVEGVDFTRRHDPKLIGRKALAVSISDIAACAGLPRYALVSLGAPAATSVKFVEGILKGLHDIAGAYRINIVGGDLSSAKEIVINTTLCGVVEKKRLVKRSGAKTGDIIFVSGRLGGSIRGKHFTFEPRVKAARYLTQNFKINAMCDISDGLCQDLGHIIAESRVGALLYESLIPVSRSARGIDEALYMGEDFELLFTIPAAEAGRLIKKKADAFWPIGEIRPQKEGLSMIGKDNKFKAIRTGAGYRHY